MNTKKVNIAGQELLLYELKAKDVFDMNEFTRTAQNEENPVRVNIFVGVQTILASLRPNIEELKRYQIIKKYRFKKIINYENLILKLSVTELDELVTAVHLLGGTDIKKKVVPEDQESESAEKLARG